MRQTLEYHEKRLREMEQFKTHLLSSDEVAGHWPRIAEELQKVDFAWEKWWTLDSFFTRAVARNLQIWAAGTDTMIHLFVFSQVVVYPQRNILQVFLAFGNSLERALPSLEASITQYAQYADCKSIEIHGRSGWARWLRRYGGHVESVVISREIRKEGIH